MDSLLKVKVITNGPLLVTATFEVEKPDGEMEAREGSTYHCRRG